LSEHFEQLLDALGPVFASPEDFARARTQWLAGLLNLGRHTVTGALSTAGAQHRDWSAEYRLLQRLPVEPIFAHVQREALAATDEARPWVVALDDSITRKTGRCIPGCGWRKDPLGPPFNLNFVWGQRVLQFSAAIPADDGSARLVPVAWQEAPLPKKPSRHADAATQDAYVEARKQANINQVAAERMASLRKATERSIHWVVDGRFTNRTLLRRLPENTVLIGRVRKDTKLYAPCAEQPGKNGRPRKYGDTLPTPEQLRTDETIAWRTVSAFAAEKRHDFKIKTLSPILARITGVDTLVRVVVIAPLGYRLKKGGRLLYRQPAYLICTDPQTKLEDILQEYLWRWDIEVNFRDEKCLLGVSEAQVREPEAVRRQPACAVAAYALLLLAAHKTYGADQLPPSVPLAKWRRREPPRRAATGMLINQLRVELWSRHLRRESLSHFCSRSSPHQNSVKPSTDLASALFYSHH
jgi:DDE superfamily endonuclease